jgi:hypothetical protein
MKKLLLTSAIAAVAFSSSSFAEIKVSGEIEQTWTSYSYDATATKIDGQNAIGSEANVKFTGDKELSNGAKVNASIRMENKGSTFGVDQKELGITIGGFKAHVGIDTGSTIDGNMVAHVGQQAEDVMGALTGLMADVNMSSFQAHDKEHIGFSFKNDMGEIAVNYAPSNSTSNGANAVTDAGASATEIVFNGSLGVEGLAIKIGQQDTGTNNGSGSDEKEKFYGATYSFGKAKVGYSNRSYDLDGSTTELDGSDSYSVAYAISDNLSVAVERLDTKKKGTANKEELTLLGLSYNLGGLGIEAYYGQAKDLGGVSGADADAVQLRTVFAY